MFEKSELINLEINKNINNAEEINFLNQVASPPKKNRSKKKK